MSKKLYIFVSPINTIYLHQKMQMVVHVSANKYIVSCK